jgi:signal transduction histidine kinase
MLFDPFVSGREAGIGLGLSIAHQIVKRHGGSIDVQDNPIGGTIFTIVLPVQRKEA